MSDDIKKIAKGLEMSEYPDCFIFRVMKDANVGISSSGKTQFNANTSGWIKLPSGFTLMLMCGTTVVKSVKAKASGKKSEKIDM